MYEEFFGLTEKPFSIQPDPSFLYWGRGHRLAYAMLEYGVLNHAGISIVTGEVGCGKTTLIHRLLDQLYETHSVALLSNIQEGRGELLSWVLMGFGQPFAGKSHVELFSQLQSYFISEYAKGRRVVLIIDEAQNLSIDMLEELRLLSNINAGKDQLLQLILVGQPQLKDLLNRPDLLQLAQRVGADFHLTPLSGEEIDAYLDTRLRIAGADRRIFTERAVDLIAEQSGGVPRVINIIADTALVYAFSAQEELVDVETIWNVIRDKLDYGVFSLPAPADAEKEALRNAREEPGLAAFARRDAAGPARIMRAPGVERRSEAAARINLVEPAPTRHELRAPPRPEASRLAEKALANNYADSGERTAPARDRPDDDHDQRYTEHAPVATEVGARREPPLTQERAAAPAEIASARPAAEAYPAPRAPRAETASRQGVGVVVIGAGGAPEATLASIGDGRAVVFVAQTLESDAATAAREAGVDVVEIGDRALSPGRARNAGYRQALKASPGLAYVQFVEAGVMLDADWLGAAETFMERRPEVAVVEGWLGEPPQEEGDESGNGRRDAGAEAGEIHMTGQTALVRAEAFEAAGGFRGDLPVNETIDLCVRLRRRGAHIWRLDAQMAIAELARGGIGAWWSRKTRVGYEFAHGAALHGEPPEKLFARDCSRALVWGGFLPALIATSAIAAAVGARFLFPPADPAIVATAALGAGMSLYLVRIITVAVRRGAGGAAWSHGLSSTLGSFPEFFGAWRYYFGGAQTRRINRAAT